MDSNVPVVTEEGRPQAPPPETPVELVTIRADELEHLRAKASVLAVVARSALFFMGLLAVLVTIIVIIALLVD